MNSTLKAGLILVFVFAIGAMAGIAGIRWADGPSRRNPSYDPYRQNPEIVEHIEARLVDRYDLTEEQRVAVRRILMNAQEKYDAFFRETRPAFDDIRRVQQMAIRELMSPEQREQFEAWLEESRKRREAHGDRPGNGRPSGRRPPKGPKPLKEEATNN